MALHWSSTFDQAWDSLAFLCFAIAAAFALYALYEGLSRRRVPFRLKTVKIFAAVAVVVAVIGLVFFAIGQSATVDNDIQHDLSHRAKFAGLAETAGLPSSLAAVPLSDAIPMRWNVAGSSYLVDFSVGGSAVSAVMDSGSAQFIVATTECGTCTGTRYDPPASTTAIVLLDPRKGSGVGSNGVVTPGDATQYASQLCTYQAGYVSQTDSVQMYEDTVTFPRVKLPLPALCTTRPSVLLSSVTAAPPLTVTQFPVGGIYANTGSSSANVLGMSGVLTTRTMAGPDGTTLYITPSCQTVAKPAYESPVIQAIAQYYEALGLSTVWSHFLGETTGVLMFAPPPSCVPLYRVPLVSTLPRAVSIGATPWRYYVVNVVRMQIRNPAANSVTPLAAPRYFIVDSGTTQCQLPGSAGPETADLASGISGSQLLDIVVGVGSQTATLTYIPADVTFSAGAVSLPVFAAMPASEAASFSADLDVGILGNTALRNFFVSYDLGRMGATSRFVSFSARVRSA